MQLNLPLNDEFLNCKSLLLAGMGGGFDVFCAIPLYLALKAQGVNVHLASLSFAPVEHVRGVEKLSENLFEVTAEYKTPLPYFPEGRLVRWFAEERGEDVTVWCLRGIGGATITDAYAKLATHLQLDGVLLVDGGVDGLLRGGCYLCSCLSPSRPERGKRLHPFGDARRVWGFSSDDKNEGKQTRHLASNTSMLVF
jgi:hypothetical protein